jgi:hypothetical protein
MGAKAQFSRLGQIDFGGEGAKGKRTGSTPKNKFTKGGIFFDTGNDHKNHHVYHAFHHTLTIKKPRSAPVFLQNPL